MTSDWMSIERVNTTQSHRRTCPYLNHHSEQLRPYEFNGDPLWVPLPSPQRVVRRFRQGNFGVATCNFPASQYCPDDHITAFIEVVGA